MADVRPATSDVQEMISRYNTLVAQVQGWGYGTRAPIVWYQTVDDGGFYFLQFKLAGSEMIYNVRPDDFLASWLADLENMLEAESLITPEEKTRLASTFESAGITLPAAFVAGAEMPSVVDPVYNGPVMDDIPPGLTEPWQPSVISPGQPYEGTSPSGTNLGSIVIPVIGVLILAKIFS